MRPEVRIDSFKLEHLINESCEKIAFLGKINESEDNSSELAGFEINKLLREQSKLEQDYASLIKRRSQLKGISNREEHKKVEEKISNVSRSLKENTKKLCRLFKENADLDSDSKKVRSDREELLTLLGQLLDNIDKNTMDAFTESLNTELGEQNRLGDYMKTEKELALKIKDLKAKISEETKEFEDLRKEKKNTVHQLREEVTKAQTASHAKLRYEKKVSDMKVETAKRLNNQKMQQIQKEKDYVRELQNREEEVAKKQASFLTSEADHLLNEAKKTSDRMEDQKDVIRTDKLRLEVLIAKEKSIMANMREELAVEKAHRAAEEERVANLLKDQADEEEKNKVLDEKMKIIQQQFEEFMEKVGPSKKKKGGKKKK